MACKLVYNNEGQFVKALTPDGKESSLFKQILSIPHIRSVKEASELYANIFAKKMYFIMGEKGAKRLDDKINKGLKIPAEAIEKQLTSEVFGQLPNSKKEGWYPRYEGIPNHLWDCAYMTYILIEFDGLKERIFEN